MPPFLFVLKNTFEYCSEIFSEEDENLNIYNERLERDWIEFWATKGDEIVNCSWSNKYSDYLLIKDQKESEPDEIVLKQQIVCQEEATDLQSHPEEILSEEDNNAFLWQDLWNTHYTEVYQKIYQLFSIVHYHHYSFYRPDIQEELLENSSTYFSDEDQEPELLAQSEELQALGLPTSFGGANNKYYRKYQQDSSSDSIIDEEEDEEKENNMTPSLSNEPKKQSSKKKKKNNRLKRMPKFILEDRSLRSYWHRRFSLFLRFDEGIQLDRESWFSVTPEKIAIHMAERLSCDTIIDAFCGSGGNAIQFAFKCSKVIAIDIDPEKIKNARHNASIYGVADKIDFIIGDFIQLSRSLKADVVFLSPPWGGPQYISQKEYDIEESLAPLGATELAEQSRMISPNIAFFLPKNSNPKQIAKLAGIGNRVEVEHNYLGTRLVGLTAIYGDWLIDKQNLKDK